MKIVGFGACMIGGYPLGDQHSFFSLLVEQLRDRSAVPIEKGLVSLGGLPLIQAVKHFESDVLALNPDVLILQFGNQDVSVQLGKYLKTKFKLASAIKPIVKVKPSSDLSPYKARFNVLAILFFKYLIGKAFGIEPTKCNLYMSILLVKQIATICEKKCIKLFVLSSFPSNDMLQNSYGNKYAFILNTLADEYNYTFINLHVILNRYRKCDILLSDGCHLSKLGHQIVMQAILDNMGHPPPRV